MGYIFSFIFGMLVGLFSASLYFRRGAKVPAPQTDDIESRLEALEEAMGYAMEKLDSAAVEVAAEGKSAQRTRKRRATQAPEKEWQRVISLAEEGYDPQSIAREVGKPQGQVELITKLYGKG